MLMLLSVTMVGCAGTKPISACGAFGYITASPRDTTETKQQILVHDNTYKKVCDK